MPEKINDVIIVGAGFAGLSASYCLTQKGIDHIVFDKGRMLESWRSQRWDSFSLNSTNKLNLLPGMRCDETAADQFSSATEFVDSVITHVIANELPVIENAKVISVDKTGDLFNITVSAKDKIENYHCKQLIIASGIANQPKFPAIAKNISPAIKQLHAGEYRNAGQLPAGAALVTGGAQSGCQIVNDLLDAGRKVFFSTSKVGRIPRWYRGRDIFDWLIDCGFFDAKAEGPADPKIFESRNPQISGGGNGRDTISLQLLAKKGAVIIGKMKEADEWNVFFEPNAAMHVKFADEFSNNVKKTINDFISANNINAEAPHHDEADVTDELTSCASDIDSLNLQENNINSIIWCGGFGADFSYIRLPVFNGSGVLQHKEGVTAINGLYFLGYPWLRNRKSSILPGIAEDAVYIAERVCANHKV